MLFILILLWFIPVHGYPYRLWGTWIFHSEKKPNHNMKIDISSRHFVLYSNQNFADLMNIQEKIQGTYFLKSDIDTKDLLIDVQIKNKSKSIIQLLGFDSDILFDQYKINARLSGNIIDLSNTMVIVNLLSNHCKKYNGTCILTRYVSSPWNENNNKLSLFWIGQIFGFLSNHIITSIIHILNHHDHP